MTAASVAPGPAPAPPAWQLMGAGTPSGAAFAALLGGRSLQLLGRRPPAGLLQAPGTGFTPCDLQQPQAFSGALAGVLVSFAPIWDLAPFLATLAAERPDALACLAGVVACSSSSAISKRFASNPFDRDLVQRLCRAESLLQDTCGRRTIACRILRPTLIYGSAAGYHDRNLSRLLALLRRLPLLPLPQPSGLRQPIHCRQLAAVALAQARALPPVGVDHQPLPPMAVGGDDSLSYLDLLRRLQAAAPAGDPARRCRLLPVPPRLFFSLAAPLLLLSPKRFEAVLRMGADLAGFSPAHALSGEDAQAFPVLPLAP